MPKIPNPLFVFFLLSSCAPIYIPNGANVPLFTEKGEIQLAASTGTNGTELQTAVSVTDHLALMGNFAFLEFDQEDPEDYHKHRFGEGGLGYFNTFGGKGRYEIYGGYGKGRSEVYDNYDFLNPDRYIRVRADFDRWFVQGNIGIGNRIFEGAFTYRVSYLDFYRFKELENPYGLSLSSPEGLMMEPSITLKVGGKNIKFVSQYGFSLPWDGEVDFDYQPFYLSVGILGKIPAW